MANAIPSRFGSVNSGADGSFANDYNLFLKVFSGEILTAFAETNLVMPLHVVRTISSGKSAQFPVSGKASAAYHVAGTELLGTSINHGERVINADHPLIAHTFVANIDEAIAHYDVRSEYGRLLSRALAKKADEQLLRVAILAARASATVTGGVGGTALTGATFGTDGDALFDGIFAAQRAMDEKDVPNEDRYLFLKPAQFELLAKSTKVHNKDWGGTGSIADGDIGKLAGFQILKTNNLPTGVVAAATGENNTYSGTFTNTVGVAFHREAIGTVKLRDLQMETEYMVSKQGTLMVAKYVMGHGILRPECAVELKTA